MKNRKTKEKSIVLLLLLAVVIMTIGFAAYNQTLNISGTVNVKGKPWDVRYDKTVGANGIVTTSGVTPTEVSVGVTDFSFTVELAKPGDSYSATINAKNFGTIGAILEKVTMSTLTAEQQKYLSYTVSYNGTEYTATTDGLNVALPANTSHPVIVTVTYLQPANASDLPAGDTEVTVTGNLHYKSAE